jgi:tetratricopeptide repeat protein
MLRCWRTALLEGTKQVDSGSVRPLSSLICFCVGLAMLPGKSPPGVQIAPTLSPSHGGQGNVWYTLGRVTTVSGAPVPGAKVAVFLDAGTRQVQRFETNFNGEFEISLAVELDRGHQLKTVASKNGYFDAMEAIDLSSNNKPAVLDLVLRDNQEDPDQIPFTTLISTVAARLQASRGTSEGAPEHADTLKGARGLLDAQDAEGALGLLAKAVEREPKCVEFRTLKALAMLEAGSWSGAARLLTETAELNQSLEGKSRRSDPALVLGILECWRGNYQSGAKYFLRAMETEPNSPLLLRELGRAYLLEQDWSDADSCLSHAILAGAPPETHLMRAEALLAEAKPGDAQTEMQSYLGGRRPRDLPSPLRMRWIKLDDRAGLEIESQGAASKPFLKQPLDELQAAIPELSGLEGAKDQEDLPEILQKGGERVEAYFRDFHNTISKEEIRQEILHKNGKVDASIKQSFQYLLLAWPDSSQPALNEYRTEGRKTQPTYGAREQDFMLTQGFASSSQFLLPAYQGESTFAYLGKQPMDGHTTFVIAFAQRPEAARLLGEFRAGGDGVLTLSQGVIWIDAATYQIIRMQTDLLFPLPKARLNRQTTDIHFGEVRFPEAGISFWLPRDVAVTIDWKGKLLRNQHTYSNFHLFSAKTRILPAPETAVAP